MNVSSGVLIKAMRVSLVVGTALVLINHNGIFSGGYFTPTHITQIILCYAVPFGVSLYSQITAVQHKPSDPGMPSKGDIIRR